MKLKNLYIENIRSYKKLDFTFEDGVTVISGVNGSGKSSLLEACFMGLFGSKILSKDFVLADMIFKGAENAKINLGFEHMGREYLLEQAFRYSSKSENASSSRCVLYADGENIVDQATRTYDEVCSLLNMDEEAYKNCAYIRQGEIDVLINAKPKDRQRMIDDLLQLGKLEEYRERAGYAKTAVRRLERDAKNSLSGVKAEIEGLEGTEPVAALNRLRQKVKETDAALNDLNDKKEFAIARKGELDLKIADYRERLQEIEALKQAIHKSQEDKAGCFREKEAFSGEVQGQRRVLLELGDENAGLRDEYGFGGLEIEALLLGQEKEEFSAREKVNAASKELALLLKEEETGVQALRELENEKTEAERTLIECRASIGAANKEIEEHRENIRKLEEENKGLREKAGFKIGFKADSGAADDIISVIKELEEKESLLRDRKNEVSTKLGFAFKEKETGNLNLLDLEMELQNSRAAVLKGSTEIEVLEKELGNNSKEVLEVQEQKSGVLAGLEGLGFTGDQLENLEDFSELLLENKNRLHGKEKELEATLRELENSLRKNRELLAEGKCPTCGQELKGSEIACTTEECEQKKEKLASELTDIKLQNAELEKKLNRLKDAKKLEKRISDYDIEIEKLLEKAKASGKLIETHRARIDEDSLKLESLGKRKQELEAAVSQLLPDIKALQDQEEAAHTAHSEGEKALREAKAFERKLAENASEIEALNGKIRTSLALIENYGQRLGELNEKLKAFVEKEALSKEKLKALELALEAMRKKEDEAKRAHAESEKLLGQAKKLQANLLRMENLKHKISELETAIRNLAEKVGFFDREIIERSERIRQLKEKLEGKELEHLQHDRAQFELAHTKIIEKIRETTAEKDVHLKEIGMIENSLKRLRELKEELKALENRRLYLEAVYSNAEELENTYLRVRADMRARNIGALSVLLNEMFGFMYTNNAYSHIELDPEYNLTVYRKDGTPLEPKLLSGGERAIFNLVLRCAIYRLLALGFAGDRAEGLPPMILDEPTVFLDRGHIQQLLKLIDMMRSIGVGQIIVVSHDESLIDSADHIFQVEKDPLTNMSSITRL
ncbi:DNA repair protein Rad50 [Methanosarcina sp. 2.H.T.1A.6]|uniref:DNA double-strand break repair ATPase Rad50 n=1 Tax=unclassified Methanosarcina TaxID=2644672 RepID=UPI0006216035|nr:MULTISPECIES: DNA double-strand break repair ATPase Rad50 [unclassified Methanosarcina]KKG18552.1 DNA repair protein Rad50 [Methanosarcina sp. 2.H.T.1A.3]KKG20951.1 DNA repair protein Rad50 [Methanosarcina sp. 2.H.T.1A.6]KKG22946.1 DNA repair protein Rad50 [Methanosarcina sp. 2.H.T.1A.8]KKG25017.1 DNA repair protein Rad50 [Methanosarcina sp. 2.H.T.1A.15]